MSLSQNTSPHQPCVGIAIVAWNNEEILPLCLDSVKAQTYKNITTIVLDNNSADKSVELIEKKYSWVKLVKSNKNTGFAKGNNIIIRDFMNDESIEYIVLLNSDATISPDWVEKLVAFASDASEQKIAFMQGLTVDYYDHNIVDSTHIFINHKGQAIQAGYRRPVSSIDLNPQEVFGVNAAACMLTKAYLNEQPFNYLFDEDFFMYLEDVDVAARAVALGWTNYFIPEAIAYHMGSVSSGKNPGFSVYMVNRNVIPLLVKNLPVSILLRIIPGMLFGDVRELYRIARGKNYVVFKKYILGRMKGLVITPSYIKKSKKIAKLRRRNNKYLWDIMRDGISRKS